MYYKMTDACDRIRKIFDDAKITPVHRYKVSSEQFYDNSESVTAPRSLFDQFRKLGMPRPTSMEELKEAMDYYNRVSGNTDFTKLGGD